MKRSEGSGIGGFALQLRILGEHFGRSSPQATWHPTALFRQAGGGRERTAAEAEQTSPVGAGFMSVGRGKTACFP